MRSLISYVMENLTELSFQTFHEIALVKALADLDI